MIILGLTFSLSSLTLFYAFKFIESGIACTILFIYPIIVALIMAIFFKEKITKTVICAIILTSLGIALLYKGDSGATLNLKGILLVLLSALSYAIYMVGIKKLPQIKHLRGDKLTFYVMLFGLSLFVVNLKFCTNLQILDRPFLWILVLCLAVIPTIISLETITLAIKFIGSTKTAILGALEPLTAIFFGILLFSEHLTLRKTTGILLILTGVILIIAKTTTTSQNK